jgi:hypothetical protein
MGQDGKTPVYELVVNGEKQCALSPVEMIELSMQITSALRFSVPLVRDMGRLG